MKPSTKPRKCKNPNCKKMFVPTFSSFQTTCCQGCAIVVGRLEYKKAEPARMRRMKLEAMKSNVLAGMLQKEINTCVRIIDGDRPCISCQTTTAKWDAGHYIDVAANHTVRYHFDIIHKQCSHCNCELDGNKPGYIDGIRARYGNDYFDWMQNGIPQKYRTLKLLHGELIDALARVRKLKKMLLRGEQMTREQCNQFVGIYV